MPDPVQELSWAKLKPAILTAIIKDDPPRVFEALVADVRRYMEQIIRTGQLSAMSITLQEDAAMFF